MVLIGGGGLWISDLSVLVIFEQGLDAVRQSGPLVFFGAMAFLPAIGVPVMTFLLPVGAIFGPTLGMPLVIFYSLIALAVNFSISFLLARYFLQSTVRRLLNRFGYQLPSLAGTQSTQLLVIVRVTPGIPFCIQNYLLGLTSVRFGSYFAISSLISWSFAVAYILFGEALIHGKGKVAILAVSLGIVAVISTRLARSYYARKEPLNSGPPDD